MAVSQKITTSIREKFGIDYLIPEPPTQSAVVSPEDPRIERALAVYGRRVLELLKQAPDKTIRVFDLVDDMGVDINTAQAIIERMISTGLLRLDESDKYGNHKITITTAGEQAL